MQNQEINPLKNPEEYQKMVLDSMRRYETLIGELYAIYANKIPQHKDFWTEISQEEGAHAYWLKTLEDKIGSGKVFLDEKRFHVAALNECLDDIQLKIDDAKKYDVDMLMALSISNDIEKGMIEKKFFEVFESDSAEVKETFEMLERATIEHREKVEDFWNKERSGGLVVSNSDEKTFWERIKYFFS